MDNFSSIRNKGGSTVTVKKITPEELYKKLNGQEKVLIVDVRAEDKYHDFHIEGAGNESLNIHKEKIFKLEDGAQEDFQLLPKDKEIIITCTTGNSATKCGNILSEREYNVVVLEGGITAWKDYLEKK